MAKKYDFRGMSKRQANLGIMKMARDWGLSFRNALIFTYSKGSVGFGITSKGKQKKLK